MSIKNLRNDKLFSGLVVHRYYCETFKREKPHTINPISDVAKLKFKSDEILYKLERKRWYEQYVEPFKWIHQRRKFMTIKKKVEAMDYKTLKRLYKVTMNPLLNTLHKE